VNDPQRWFSSWQRQRIWITAGGRCELCGVPLHYWTFHCDHIWPHSKGGQTVLRNAQALCPDCNYTKSNTMDLIPYFVNVKHPRQWQVDFLEKFAGMAGKLCGADRGFLLYATPGAGKTIAMFAATNWLLKAGLIEWVVIVVPAAPLCEQVSKEAKRNFRLDLRYGGDGDDSQFHGEVVTIQSLRNRDDKAIRRRNGNVLLCVDEFHHPSATNSWGDDLERSLGGAKFKLFCTGTPFRSDRTELKFVDYEELPDGEIQLNPDHSYDYRAALKDSTGQPSDQRIVRTAQFHLYDALDHEPIEWAINGTHYAHKLSDNLAAEYEEDAENLSQQVKQLRSYRFDAATEPRFNLAKRMLRDAVAELDRIRLTHGHAGGLVVCKKKAHADQVAQYMRSQLGVDPEVIYEGSDGGTSSAQIKSFRDHASPKKWIVAVQQVSEGVDIKRLRVCVWLTNKKTHLLFLQILGRIIRWEHTMIGERLITPPLDQMAHMFMPAQGSDTPDKDDPIELVKYAKEIEQDQALVLEAKPRQKCDLCGDDPASFGCGNCVNTPECPLWREGPPPPPRPERELLGAGGLEADAILRGAFWDPETLNALASEAAAIGLPVDIYIAFLKNTSPERFAKSKAIAEKAADVKVESVATRTGLSTEEVDDMTITEQLDALKREVSGLVSRLGMAIARAQAWPDDDSRRQNIFMRIHKRWTRVGGKKHENTTVGDLTAKVDWLKEQLVKVTANNIDEALIND
jgi:superfamily II DNA or RNA helicase